MTTSREEKEEIICRTKKERKRNHKDLSQTGGRGDRSREGGGKKMNVNVNGSTKKPNSENEQTEGAISKE